MEKYRCESCELEFYVESSDDEIYCPVCVESKDIKLLKKGVVVWEKESERK